MKKTRLIGALACAASLCAAVPAAAATVETVQEGDVTRQAENTPPTDSWVLYTRVATPGTGEFVSGPAAPPLGVGSLQLSTTLGSDKVFLFNYDNAGETLAGVDGDIAYSTYRSAGSLQQVASLNVQIDTNGIDTPGGFATLVFEPVYNTSQGPVVSGAWQDWIASGDGIWWSTAAINGQCAGATAPCDRTWDEIVADNPDAEILGVGINQGSGNPGLTTAVDAFAFDEVTYDFEPSLSPASKDDCKNGGWQTFNAPTFRNQGECVSSFAPGRNK